MSEKQQYIIIFITAPSHEEAEKIAFKLVEERLAACVNIIPGIKSVYIWKEELCRDDEYLLVVKSTKGKFKDIEKEVKELHSYEVPEIISFGIDQGSREYLNWINEVVSDKA
ncbi:divalent-cation tolerance protein CutA [candidate division KSB1 bacterium]